MDATSPNKQIKELNSSVVSFLKSRVLRKEDISVLEHGFNFCPSLKHYNKESLTDSFYWFIRSLKLHEYFFDSSDTTENNTDDVLDPDRCPSKWSESYPSWYLYDVTEGRSEGLQTFLKDILSGTCNALQINENEIKNNLSKKERDSLNLLANDKNIVIKQVINVGKLLLWIQRIMKRLALIS